MSLFDRRRSGRGDNVRWTIPDDLALLARGRLDSLFNDRSKSKLGNNRRTTPPTPRMPNTERT
ncbi:hypothetical protein [Streptomyces sp. UNOC14_S4]|uniref:hypothetical protein n=1 Tax=Streptomyces sp. UNOC14_S4 TaxID=2872340 RepID=UPI001E3401D6|nr:hypothetical protein [Streptomyces sp. UNOC14_S4]MCC3766011.1 hypothetical protein [Streptomyces sp. UNOC14_S4]